MIPSTASFPFPANVQPPDGAPIALARIAVHRDGDVLTMRVFTEGPGRQVVLARSAVIADYEQMVRPLRPAAPSWQVTDDQGLVWTITRGAGCGCSSPLKRFQADRWQPPADVSA